MYLVLVAAGMLGDDGLGLEAPTAHIVDEPLFGVDGHVVLALVDPLQLKIEQRDLVLVFEQTVHDERMTRCYILAQPR